MAKQKTETAPPFREKVYTTLYRLRYGWQFRSSVEISTETPIWVLGTYYHVAADGGGEKQRNIEGAPPHVLAFMEHFYSIPWMTYRSNFSPIPNTTLTTDCGWGCMVRSGQMVLATALNRHVLGSHWRLPNSSDEDKRKHSQVMSWFADCQNPCSPFSLHALMEQAVRHDNRPGDWFGPSQVAVLIRECMKVARATVPELEDVQLYVAHDCTVYVNDVLELFRTDPEHALILLVPVRLGSEALNPIYIPCIRGLLSLDYCVGIIGGRPKHSVFFIGFQEDKLIHLDPHYCQTAVIMEENEDPTQLDIKSYHCTTPRKISANKMDPSCTIGFYCKGLSQFHLLRQETEKVLAPPKQKGVYPFFTFTDKSLGETIDTSVDMQLSSLTGNNLIIREDSYEGLDFHSLSDDEEFVVVECKANAQRSFSDPGITSHTTGLLPNTNGTPARPDSAHRGHTFSAPVVTDLTLEHTTPTLPDTEENTGDILADTDYVLADTDNVLADSDYVLADTDDALADSADTPTPQTDGDSIEEELLSL